MTTSEPEADADPRPWEQPGAVRRDAEPHRGPALRLLSAAGAAAGALAALLAALACAAGARAPAGLFAFAAAAALAALVLGGEVCRAARRDLARMAKGLTDRGGQGPTEVAEALAALGLLLGLVALALLVLTLIIVCG